MWFAWGVLCNFSFYTVVSLALRSTPGRRAAVDVGNMVRQARHDWGQYRRLEVRCHKYYIYIYVYIYIYLYIYIRPGNHVVKVVRTMQSVRGWLGLI